jgi:hypothetical protein
VVNAPNIFWAEVVDCSTTRLAEAVGVAGVIGGTVVVVVTDRSANPIKTVFVCRAVLVGFFTTGFAETTFADLVVATVIVDLAFVHAYVVKTPLTLFTDVVRAATARFAESALAVLIVEALGKVILVALSSALALNAPNIFWAFGADCSATRLAEAVGVAGVISKTVIVVVTSGNTFAIKTVFFIFTLIAVNSAAGLAESTLAELVVSAVI